MILGIYGSGGQGREILDLAQEINALAEKWENIVFIDDFKRETVINGAEVFTSDEFKASFSADNAKAVIAVGEPKVRQILRKKMAARGYGLQTLIHPAAFVGTETSIGDGTIIQFGSFVSCNVKIGANVLMQPKSCVAHDSVIGSDSVISTFVVISGNCTIGKRTYIGIGVPVRENISIGSDSIIGMGASVLHDIPDNVIAVGSPARVTKANERGRVFQVPVRSNSYE